MIDARSHHRHIADDEIEAYWTNRLSDAESRRLEEHYLVCESCHERVQFVGDLAATVRDTAPSRHRPSLPTLAAAVLAAVCVVLAWQWWRTAGDLGAALTRAERAEAGRTAAPRDNRDDRTVTVVRLEPPLRAGGTPQVSAPGAPALLLDIDAREVGAPGTRFDVAVLAADRRPVIAIRGLTSSAIDGRLSLPVAAHLLVPGDYVVEIRSGDATAELPFSIKP